MNDLLQVINFFETHQAMDTVLAGWLVHIWANIVANNESIQKQGGVIRIVRNFFWTPMGKQTTKENEKTNSNPSSVSPSASGNGPK